MLFGKKKSTTTNPSTTPVERVTTVLGPNINWKGDLRGTGGVRIEGTLEGEIEVRGMVIIGETGRVTCEQVKADTVIVAGAVNGQITAEKLEIRSTGRVFGDVKTKSFSTEEGAFLRGKITMEDEVELGEPTPPHKQDQSEDDTESTAAGA
jgi:cytoskeletal protein CcmA (bactofilin family)